MDDVEVIRFVAMDNISVCSIAQAAESGKMKKECRESWKVPRQGASTPFKCP
jgi:hypothetical protein